MPRIRTIKPRFWDDIRISRLTRDTRLFYVGMWNFTDDLGVIVAEPLWLKSKIFPYDVLLPGQLESWLDELKKAGLITPVAYGGERFLYLPVFTRDQLINRPNMDEVNIPKDLLIRLIEQVDEQSLNHHGTITDPSLTIEESISRVEESKGKECRVEECKGKESPREEGKSRGGSRPSEGLPQEEHAGILPPSDPPEGENEKNGSERTDSATGMVHPETIDPKGNSSEPTDSETTTTAKDCSTDTTDIDSETTTTARGRSGDTTETDPPETSNAGKADPEPDEPPGPPEPEKTDYERFCSWIKENTPFVGRMERQISENEFTRLKQRYNSAQIIEIITKMDNYRGLQRKYNNVYRTFLNWAQKEYGN